MKCHAQTTDFFEIICQRVLAGCLFMREAPGNIPVYIEGVF